MRGREGAREREEESQPTTTPAASHSLTIILILPSTPGDLSEANYKDLTGIDLRGKKLYKAQFRSTIFDKAGEG